MQIKFIKHMLYLDTYAEVGRWPGVVRKLHQVILRIGIDIYVQIFFIFFQCR